MIEINNEKEKITFSIEKCHRLFKDKETNTHFFVVQFYIDKNRLLDLAQYKLIFFKEDNIIFNYDILINKLEKKVYSTNGLLCVDPLIETKKLYNITFHIPPEIFEQLKKINNLNVKMLDFSNKTIIERDIQNIKSLFSNEDRFSIDSWYCHLVEDNNKIYAISERDCNLTMHLGSNDKKYKEEDYFLKANEKFLLSKYIGKYSYIGVQCSYEDIEPEVEEKHILIGLNGMYISGNLKLDFSEIHPIFNYNPKYQQIYEIEEKILFDKNKYKSFVEISSIDNLLLYYIQNNIRPFVFPCDYDFIIQHYSINSTYNQDKLFSSNKNPAHSHTISQNCSNCPLKSECLQVVPSGLSKELFKRNLSLEEYSECDIYNLLNK